MLPTLDYLPADEILYLKREELMREFQEIRLLSAARQDNPGFAERARIWIARFFHAPAPRRVPRQSYIDSAIRMAA